MRSTELGQRAHDGRNLLSTVVAIAALSIKGDGPAWVARDAFLGRIEALSHGLGDEEDQGGVRLAALVQRLLGEDAGKAWIAGPPLLLGLRAAQSFALALHELTTNARRHGALASSGGLLFIRWELSEDAGRSRLRFEWEESGGGPTTPPAHRGFGLLILGSVIGGELGGKPTLCFDEAGFRYTLDAPLSQVGVPAAVIIQGAP